MYVKAHERTFYFWQIDLVTNQCSAYFAAQNKIDSVAQLVEQLTLNQWVESSNLSGVTIFKLRL